MRLRNKILYTIILIVFSVPVLFSILVIKQTISDENAFRLDGWITKRSFDKFVKSYHKFYEEHGRYPKKLVVNSPGGDAFAAMAIGKYIREKGLHVEVGYYCLSACANYIFTAGKTKYLHKYSAIIYHGGALQKNLWEKSLTAKKRNHPADDKEAEVQWSDHLAYSQRLRRYLKLKKGFCHQAKSCYHAYVKSEKVFFKQIGVDQKITVYGQIGPYKKRYDSKKYSGFYYNLKDMKKMGVSNIVLKDKEWNPLRYRPKKDMNKFYKVDLSRFSLSDSGGQHDHDSSGAANKKVVRQ